jgi:hypothetical protein
MSPEPTIDLPDDELAAVTAAIRGVIEDDKFPHAPRLDPLRAALGEAGRGVKASPRTEGPAGSQNRQTGAAIGGGTMMAEDVAPLVEALAAIVEAARAYLPPDGIGKDAFITRVLEAVDNPRIIAALAAHGHPVAGT